MTQRKLFTGKTLIDAGWKSGPHFPEAIRVANDLLAHGVSDSEILQQIEEFNIEDQPKIELQDAVHLAEAIEPITELDISNLDAVRKCMGSMCRLPIVTKAAIMPDACPAGPGITVGGAIVTENAIIPAAHSADICCSMSATFFTAHEFDSARALDILQSVTRFGPGGRKFPDYIDHRVLDEDVWTNQFLHGLEHYAACHMGDQGDGNHFAYLGKIDVSEEMTKKLSQAGKTLLPGQYYVLVTHHGSRGLGAQLYKRGVKAAARHTEKVAKNIPKHGHWLDYRTEEGKDYWDALQYISRWTVANHEVIHALFMERMCEAQGAVKVTSFGNEHNFVWHRSTEGKDLFYHGKGATPAWKDENGNPLLGLIPLNMSAPILVVLGEDNSDYLSFAPHGAGRNESRTSLMKRYRSSDGKDDNEAIASAVEEATSGIDVRWYSGKADLSETPMGYKDADQVTSQIEKFGLAKVIGRIEPLGCIMAGHIDPPWLKKKQKSQ